MVDSRIKISSVVQNQIPDFVKEDYPLFVDFLKQYYISQESDGASLDLIQNIDQYIKIDKLTNLTESTTITSNISFFDDTINVESTAGFSNSYGLIQIDDEIITYTGKTSTSFTGCVRGFSGVTSYEGTNTPDELVFTQSSAAEHTSGASVTNLSILFLKEFLTKVKKQVTPGFEGRSLYSGLNEKLFISRSRDFYVSKGTEESFKILFRALYGEEVQVIRPSDFLIKPSDAQYRITRDLVVESISGDPLDLVNRTLFQDETDNFKKASGSINDVQKISRDGKDYYVISLDYDFDKDINVSGSLSGEFSIHPSTKVVKPVSIGSSVIDVDSTVGFPTSGSLVATLSNGTDVNIQYGSKSYNQFFECSGIDQSVDIGQLLRYDTYAYGYSGIGTDNPVKVRITGVLSDLNILENSYLYDENQIVKIKSLGITLDDVKSNNWLFNLATTYNVESVTLLNLSNNSYTITTYDENNISVGDRVKIILTNGTEVDATVFVSGINNKKSFSIKGQSSLDVNLVDKVRREISRANSTNYPETSIYSTNIQNVYAESQVTKDTIYVTSPSIPNYFEQPLNIKDRSATLSGSFSGNQLTLPNHGFYTGDAVVYRPSNSQNTIGIEEGTYFVQKVNDDTIRLSRSRANIYSNLFVTFSGTVTNDRLEYLDFSYQKLSSQKLVRKISNPENDSNINETAPGATGILINGVEILNYKSKNSLFYGEIESVDVLSPGSSYDVINPPVLTVSDPSGSGFVGHCSVEGSVERINIIDGGFDYLDVPKVTISGGSGQGVAVAADMVTFRHEVPFNSSSSAGLVDLTNNTIAFSTYHKFRDSERVIYRTEGENAISGLTTDSSYYVSIIDEYTVKLHTKFEDSILGINTISINSYGNGIQKFESFANKKKIGSIIVSNGGSGYKNRKTVTNSSGINTTFNLINIPNHGYNSGEIIVYTAPTSPIEGLSNNSSYYVTKIDDNNFRLSNVGVGSTGIDFYYNTAQFVDLSTAGSGIHTFNYQPITVSVSGIIGVSTLSGQNFNAVLEPIVRGEIKSIFIENNGSSYGSSEILDYNRQPTFTLTSGSGAQLLPIISNSTIQEVLVVSSGSGYNSIPDLMINGSGTGAVLTPVISNGQLIEVKVINGGFGYSSANTTITVTAAGSGAELHSNPQKWTLNLFERLLQTGLITDDDGVIDNGLNNEYGLEYTHLYSPRKLRQIALASKYVDGVLTYQPDLRIVNNIEVTSDAHSPIIGWAYDGNPIYGPYGYDTPVGGSIRSMVSGYQLKSNVNRPSLTTYPIGSFIEDYEFVGSGDLDKYNGRFCITPDFPNGVYAYFTTINGGSVDATPPFKNYKRPVFPYFIGNEYKSKPIQFNFDRYSNQDNIDPGSKGWLRNTYPYNLRNENSFYDYLINPNKIKEQNSLINFTAKSGITSIGISSGGQNYQVYDLLSFNNEETEGSSAYAKVSKLSGKYVTNISVAGTEVSNIEFTSFNSTGQYIGFSTVPHNLENLDIVSIGGLSTSLFNQSEFYSIGVRSDTFVLRDNIGNVSTTGIVTYFNVSGSLTYPYVRENDIFQINSEKVKVLNIDVPNSRIRVLRSYSGTSSQSHSVSDVLYEDSRKFTFSSGIQTSYNFNLNKTLYFDPKESLGLGTSYGVGIGTTITFSNPGSGIVDIFIPTKSIYLPNHQLITGTELVYSAESGNPISVSTDGVTSSQLTEGQKLYVSKISNDLIGLSTSKVGLGSTGTFVGINSSIVVNTLFFTGIGTGVFHSLKTNLENVLSGGISKNEVTVSTSSTHGLLRNDLVDISVVSGISTTLVVKYNETLKKLVIDPKNFASGNVNSSNNTITIQNHKFKTGDKVIHTSSSPAGGLETNREYYVVVVDSNTIKLSTTYYNSTLFNPIVVDITSSSLGTLSLVNPQIEIYKNQIITFDVSDSSLSYTDGSQSYAAFDFNLYTDSLFKNEFKSSKTTATPEVEKNGTIGVTTSAYVRLTTNDNIPQNLYYAIVPVQNSANPLKDISLTYDDENIVGNNSIILSNTLYSGQHLVSGITSTSFKYNIREYPERSSYTDANSTITYTTNSLSAYGPISEVRITNPGVNYNLLPGISSVFSNFGTGAILEPYSSSIGNIINTRIEDIGFEYSSDKTVRPVAKLPQILKVIPLSSFERIGIASQGVNYIVSPNLIVIDSVSNKVINDVSLEYTLGDEQVTIIKNTTGINNKNPLLIPVNNSNGIGISTISYNSSSGDVTVELNVGFSTLSDFPFEVGDRVLIENINVGLSSLGKGYNSENYNYQLFTINSVDPNIGGIGATVGYNLSNYLSGSEFPGSFDAFRSSGRIIPEKYFPIFDITLTKNKFLTGETVVADSASGVIQIYDSKNEYVTISTDEEFVSSELIKGSSSDSQGIIRDIISPYSEYNVSSNSIVRKGWNLNTGFLNDSVQRMHDNDYYQYFSYAIKSKVEYEDWNNPVSNLNHTAGFKKFSDLIVESTDETGTSGIATDQNSGDFIGINDLISVVDLECVNDFDIATENTFTIGSNVISSEIVFNSKEMQDYFQSVGNRVLTIDDISSQFNSNPRTSRYSIVDTFLLTDARYRKMIAYVRDKRYTEERQISIISLLHDGSNGYINHYGRVDSSYDMGSFDFTIAGSEGSLLFYPTKYSVNDFDTSVLSYSIKDGVSGIGTTSFGTIAYVNTSQTTIPSGLSTSRTIIGIGTTYRASKILLEFNDGISHYEVDEITVIHDGANVGFLEYGQLTAGSGSLASSGLGTYSAYISGSNLNIDIYPYSTLTQNFDVNVLNVSVGTGAASTTSSITQLNSIDLGSSYTSIASSSSPTENTILSVNSVLDTSRNTKGLYVIACVEDITNNQHQVSEMTLIATAEDAFISEYGNVETGSGIGTFGANIVGDDLQLYFTPNPSINSQVRLFYNSLTVVDPELLPNEIDLNNGIIDVFYGSYSGTDSDIRRDFQLTHKGSNIFRRVFDGSSPLVVDITEDTISLPDHFFVTGEEIVYDTLGTAQPIGIATTTITGIGTTTLLPSSLYVVKVSDISIKVAASASEALSTTPNTLNFTSVGVGTNHVFTAKNQNQKVLISIDNMIQSPIVSSAITSSLLSDFSITQNTAYFSGITSFFGGDLIKINDEIMRVETVGFGSDLGVLVRRPWMGSTIASHPSGSTIYKISGNYNIVGNTLNFYEAPYGPTPIGSTTNPPDERDFTGITTNSTFSGRSFLRSGILNGTSETYSKNYIFDDISNNFNGISTEFTLKSNGSNISGISSGNAIILIKDIFQGPQRLGVVDILGDYKLTESSGITTISFTGDASQTPYDINNSSIPVGGQIVSVGSTSGFAYQPLVSAGGTAIVSIAGTIQSISIGNSGSGYRSGIQTVNVGVATTSLGNYDINIVGTALVNNGRVVSVAITNPGTGYTFTAPPFVIFDSPLSYSNIPLIYSSSSPLGGIGTEAVVDIVVGQGSSVIDFVIKNTGYAYGQGDILTVAIGGTVGIPTDTTKTFKEFQLNIEKTYSMEFNGWSIGDLQVLDEIQSQFDGRSVKFALRIDGVRYSIKSKPGSNVDVQATLLVFVNDILQVPGEGYIFNGGSTIEFTEAPKIGDTCKILFYKGTGNVDVASVDILETIKVGDTLQLNDYDNILYQENKRFATSIESTDIVGTNPYVKPGVNRDSTYERPLTWCKQRNDTTINGQIVSKDRIIYESLINPSSYLIQPLVGGETEIYVDNIAPFFDATNENTTSSYRNSITILSQDPKVGASATALVSAAGKVFNLAVTNNGQGYVTPPTVTISDPIYSSGSLTYQQGTVQSITYSEYGAGSMTSFFSGDIDDTFFTIPLPTTFNFLGNNYSNVYLGSNGYITFGSGSSIDSSLSFNNPNLPKIHIYPGDRRVTNVYTRTLTNSVRIRVEGYNFGSSAFISAYTYELEINSDGYVDINYVNVFDSPQGGIGDGTNPFIGTWTSSDTTSYRVYTKNYTLSGITTATATASVSAGIVTNFIITNTGLGYTFTNPPTILVEPPASFKEVDSVSDYSGDNGVVVGFGTTTIGITNKFIFDFYIPEDSYLRDINIVGTAVTLSGISTGDYFVIRNSNVGLANTSQESLRNDNSLIGIGTQFVDNVYQVYSKETASVSLTGIGTTNVVRILANVSAFNASAFDSTIIKFDSTLITFDSSTGSLITYAGSISTSRYFGEFSWGKITVPTRTTSNTFNFYGTNGVTGLTTSAMVIRSNPLKYINYL
jgi:hypothetical protein